MYAVVASAHYLWHVKTYCLYPSAIIAVPDAGLATDIRCIDSGQHRRTVGQDDDTHDSISNFQDTVKDKRQDERPVSERCAAQKCCF